MPEASAGQIFGTRLRSRERTWWATGLPGVADTCQTHSRQTRHTLHAWARGTTLLSRLDQNWIEILNAYVSFLWLGPKRDVPVGRMRPQDHCARFVIAVYLVVVDSCPIEITLGSSCAEPGLECPLRDLVDHCAISLLRVCPVSNICI